MKKLVMILIVAALVVPAMAGPSLGTVNLLETDVYPVLALTISFRNFNGGVYTGIYHFAYTEFTSNLAGITDYGFCIEAQLCATNSLPYSIVDLADAPNPDGPGGLAMGDTKANYIKELWALHFADIVSNETAAAFQLAVWEIVYQDQIDGWDVTTGYSTGDGGIGFAVSNATTTLASTANGWLSDLTGSGLMANLVGLTNGNGQDYVVAVVPVPGAVLLGSIGMGLVGWMKRRKSL